MVDNFVGFRPPLFGSRLSWFAEFSVFFDFLVGFGSVPHLMYSLFCFPFRLLSWVLVRSLPHPTHTLDCMRFFFFLFFCIKIVIF